MSCASFLKELKNELENEAYGERPTVAEDALRAELTLG